MVKDFAKKNANPVRRGRKLSRGSTFHFLKFGFLTTSSSSSTIIIISLWQNGGDGRWWNRKDLGRPGPSTGEENKSGLKFIVCLKDIFFPCTVVVLVLVVDFFWLMVPENGKEIRLVGRRRWREFD